ncbi:protein-L-isoaspartate O-methyltransferase [Mumia zhuanghuii]|uniref:Protein-L-isoaspartate O-methyltransferase n=1 Tax=Mumia zhuanghuii TaxID=2585211 RepID=A0A5C4ML75_9ACTN|nr:protein-L-isoaspartate O-methyltransferase [Mumia zhuanghuii]TNC42834.1 protein-L-isoaspartate O-methyltransferase [Mumia zhuanghuii]TNC46057.1 protein-L-isoaspartate O-methyltransferase [Mumia zhuanghuii]
MGDPVGEVMRRVRREDFLPEDKLAFADVDEPVPIGWGQTNSQPRTVEAMLRLLDVAPGMRVLDVGAGSGWTTALLAHLVGSSGEVVGVEVVPELRERANRVLERLELGRARIELAGDVLGWPEAAPYDRVLVSAQARSLPTPLVDQLADGGVLVVPVRGRMTRVVSEGGRIRVSEHGAYRFVPLLGW